MAPKFHIDGKHSLRELAHKAIAENPYFFGQNISVDVRGEDVILDGSVSTYYQKQLAQEMMFEIDGVHSVQNEIEVASIWTKAGMRTPTEGYQSGSLKTTPQWSF